MKRIFAAVLLAALVLTSMGALADGLLTAHRTDDGITVTWSAGDGEILTLLRDGWPVCVVCVTGKNSYTFPGIYADGRCTVRLQTSTGCLTANVTGAAQDETPVAPPENDPTEAPALTPAPTEAPVATPRPQVTLAPIATPAVTPEPTREASVSGTLADRVVALVNEDRAKYGAGALAIDPELTRAALVRAYEIAEYFSHTRPDGTSWSTVSDAVSAENIAMGYRTAEKAEAAWLSSEGHRRNMLNGNYSRTGVAAVEVDGVMYWVQLFGR